MTDRAMSEFFYSSDEQNRPMADLSVSIEPLGPVA